MESAAGTEAHGGARRSAPELATLLLELARLVKARRYYGPGDARLVTIFERCMRCWSTDLKRTGTLELEVGPQGFREVGGRGVLTHERLAELHRELGERGIHSVTFDAALDAEAFAGFAEVLASEQGLVSERGGFAAMLLARVPFGIRVVDRPPTAGLAGTTEPDGAILLEASSETTEPLVGEPEDELGVLLQELDQCENSSQYADIARRVATLAERHFEGDDIASFERAIRAFTDDAEGKSDPRVCEMARSFLGSLIGGHRLDHLIDRAAADASAGIESLRTLLVIGDDVADGLVRMATAETDRARRDVLFTVVLALGDRGLPPLFDLLGDGSTDVVRAAVRLAGDMQHPAVVNKLAEILQHEASDVREEAARALVRVGSDDAIAALARSARANDAATVALAVQCLAATNNSRALPPLENALDRAIEARDTERAKEVIRALGRMTDTKAARPLVALLKRRARMQRWMRDLKVAAITALGNLPGDDAVGALAQAAQYRDAQMRKAAQIALDRRASTLARG